MRSSWVLSLSILKISWAALRMVRSSSLSTVATYSKTPSETNTKSKCSNSLKCSRMWNCAYQGIPHSAGTGALRAPRELLRSMRKVMPIKSASSSSSNFIKSPEKHSAHPLERYSQAILTWASGYCQMASSWRFRKFLIIMKLKYTRYTWRIVCMSLTAISSCRRGGQMTAWWSS